MSQVPSSLSGLQLSGVTQQGYSNPLVGPQYQQQLAALQSGYGELASQLASGYGALYQSGMDQANQFGATDRQQIINQYLQQRAQQDQGLVSRGLGNSTVLNSVDTGLVQNERLNLTASAEAAARQRLAVIQGLGSQSVAGPAQAQMAGLSAQQQLGMQYLALLGQMGTHTAANYVRPAVPPMNVQYMNARAHPTTYSGGGAPVAGQDYNDYAAGPGVGVGGGTPAGQAPGAGGFGGGFGGAPAFAPPDAGAFDPAAAIGAQVGAAAALTGQQGYAPDFGPAGGYGDAGGYGEGVSA